jgi:hypothetical protein
MPEETVNEVAEAALSDDFLEKESLMAGWAVV